MAYLHVQFHGNRTVKKKKIMSQTVEFYILDGVAFLKLEGQPVLACYHHDDHAFYHFFKHILQNLPRATNLMERLFQDMPEQSASDPLHVMISNDPH